MEKLNELFEKFFTFFRANPKYAWLLIAVVLIPLGIGAILGKSWAVDPANTNQKMWYNLLGGKIFGKILGLIFLLAGFGSIYLFFIWK